MDKFTTLDGIAAPLPLINVDTDMIIPKQYLKTIKRTGLGVALFSEMRYADDGSEKPDFVLNRPAYRDARILVAGDNFGCGSSREQAATAILAKGIRLVITGSFGNIFARNSINNALMGIEVPGLIKRLREVFDDGAAFPTQSQAATKEPDQNSQSLDSPPPGPPTISQNTEPSQSTQKLTRRTGWTLEWDVRRSMINIQEGKNGRKWSQKVDEIPPNVQEIIAVGGLESWVKQRI